MKAVKKPIEIDVEEFKGVDSSSFAKTKEENGVFKVFNELHNSWIEVKIGDFLNVSKSSDIYPIDVEYFKENYNLV